MAIVVFDPAAFKIRYPEFSAVSNAALQLYFNDAELYLSNTDDSPEQNINRRTSLLWMLTAHIGLLSGVLSATGNALPVGRVSSATEGSVSASLDYMMLSPGTGPWFQQTQYGASFWAATSALRGFKYILRQKICL
jgi:hypothetical protein